MPVGELCSVEGCLSLKCKQQWCDRHYRKKVKYGDPSAGRDNVKRDPICSVAGCNRETGARGWCAMHYRRWKRNGDPLKTIRAPQGLGSIRRDGYKILHINGRPVLEHRWIMEQHLGRPLSSQEVVHHIDGNPLNSSFKNLLLLPDNAAHRRLHASKAKEEHRV